jgi:cytochrome P450
MKEIEQLGQVSSGELIRVDFGVARAHVATHPDHVQRILRDQSDKFLREGTFWRPLHRLFGESILGEGPDWELSRRTLQPVLTTRHVNSVADRLADSINRSVSALDGPIRAGRPINADTELDKIVNRAVLTVFFGEKISEQENDRLAPAFSEIAVAIAFRFLLPFLPESVRVPGDRIVRRGVREMDAVLFSLIEKYRSQQDEALDFFSALCRARTAEGEPVTERWIRNNLFSMFATATETTVGALTWLWPLLDAHPDVASRLYEEIERVVGRGPVQPSHLPELTYTRQVIQEVLRLYPVGWLFPRRAVETSDFDGITLKAGDSVLLSPFLTHRLEAFWPDPERFDPDRFAPTRSGPRRHRYSYFPFGGGPHKCIGEHVFNLEAELIVAGILSRYRPVSCTTVPFRPQVGAILRPRRRVEVRFHPV